MIGIGIGIAVVVVVALFATGVVRVFHFGPAVSASSCQEAVPSGVSPAAANYLGALNNAYIGWTQVSRSLSAEHDEVHLDDLMNQATTDEDFLVKVEGIRFTGAAAVTAKQYIAIVTQYVQALTTVVDQYGYYANDHQVFEQLNNSRDVLAHELRADLDLPAAKCTILRP